MAVTHLRVSIPRPPTRRRTTTSHLHPTFLPSPPKNPNITHILRTQTNSKWPFNVRSIAQERKLESQSDLVEFLYEDLTHLFDGQGIDRTAYDERVKFRDPITKHDSIDGYLFNIAMLKNLFSPEFQLHWAKQTGPYEITTRWTVLMKFNLLPWKPEMVFTGTSIMGINPETKNFCSHVDYWDAIENNDYFSVEGLLEMVKQLRYYKTPDLEPPKYQILKRTANYEVTFAVGILSQFLDKPTIAHMKAALRVVKYLKNAPGQGIHLSADSNTILTAYSDSDWASCPFTRTSTSGYCVFLGKSLISWKSKKQANVSRSSSEAEYRSLSYTSCELMWLKTLLRDFHINQSSPIVLFCDNMSAIHLTKNPVFHERTKHLEIDCHFVREKVLEGIIKVLHVGTNLQLADIFTKNLSSDRLKFLLFKMHVTNRYAHLEGEYQEKRQDSCYVKRANSSADKEKNQHELKSELGSKYIVEVVK